MSDLARRAFSHICAEHDYTAMGSGLGYRFFAQATQKFGVDRWTRIMVFSAEPSLSGNAVITTKTVVAMDESLAFSLTEAGGGQAIWAALGLMQDVQVGNTDFDDRFVVKAAKAATLRDIFESSELRRLGRVPCQVRLALRPATDAVPGREDNATPLHGLSEFVFTAEGPLQSAQSWWAVCENALASTLAAAAQLEASSGGASYLLKRLRHDPEKTHKVPLLGKPQPWWWNGSKTNDRIIQALDGIGERDVIDALLAVTRRDNAHLSQRAIETLGNSRSPAAVRGLIPLVALRWTRRRGPLAKVVSQSLTRLGEPDIVGQLTDVLHGEQPFTTIPEQYRTAAAEFFLRIVGSYEKIRLAKRSHLVRAATVLADLDHSESLNAVQQLAIYTAPYMKRALRLDLAVALARLEVTAHNDDVEVEPSRRQNTNKDLAAELLGREWQALFKTAELEAIGRNPGELSRAKKQILEGVQEALIVFRVELLPGVRILDCQARIRCRAILQCDAFVPPFHVDSIRSVPPQVASLMEQARIERFIDPHWSCRVDFWLSETGSEKRPEVPDRFVELGMDIHGPIDDLGYFGQALTTFEGIAAQLMGPSTSYKEPYHLRTLLNAPESVRSRLMWWSRDRVRVRAAQALAESDSTEATVGLTQVLTDESPRLGIIAMAALMDRAEVASVVPAVINAIRMRWLRPSPQFDKAVGEFLSKHAPGVLDAVEQTVGGDTRELGNHRRHRGALYTLFIALLEAALASRNDNGAVVRIIQAFGVLKDARAIERIQNVLSTRGLNPIDRATTESVLATLEAIKRLPRASDNESAARDQLPRAADGSPPPSDDLPRASGEPKE